MKYNLIIADDHKMFLDGLLSILNSENDYNILLTAKNGKHIAKYLEINPDEKIDLIITDITMPEMDGIALNKIVKERSSTIKTLVVSMHNNPDMIDNLIEHDVDGYVPKNAEKEELLKAIQTILSGEKYFSREIKDIYMENKFSKKKDEEIKLTQREIDVITLIAQEFTTQEIADKLFLSKHTIESYRKNLIAKLNVRNLAGLTKYAIKMNYVEH
ncbi:response regulator transcription factor [Aquimarina sp. MMG015]|uniref:response regulator transcription factor n=1 Tax=Aquimarina TaxID=290174 RepID=UPI0004227477|nr:MULTISPECIES: response regulator transcription factor [Aquimarina]AXT58399.1 DNA-binding response regulator [Aquimarina sp. AD1]MBQ4805110.1 response regulator transcription factor [Aquimarina sp. MMG015]RKN24938.1 DNA-binding response regulator [Aquimarina sp. AD1]